MVPCLSTFVRQGSLPFYICSSRLSFNFPIKCVTTFQLRSDSRVNTFLRKSCRLALPLRVLNFLSLSLLVIYDLIVSVPDPCMFINCRVRVDFRSAFFFDSNSICMRSFFFSAIRYRDTSSSYQKQIWKLLPAQPYSAGGFSKSLSKSMKQY